MASLRVKPVILGRKSDLTEQHLKLPSKVTHSIYFSSNLCMNSPWKASSTNLQLSLKWPLDLARWCHMQHLFERSLLDCVVQIQAQHIHHTSRRTRCWSWVLLVATRYALKWLSSEEFIFTFRIPHNLSCVFLVSRCWSSPVIGCGGVTEYAKPPSQLKAEREALAYCL